MSAEPMLSPQKIAKLTDLGYTTVRREIQRGNLPGFKVAGKLRVLESEYERWRTAQPVTPAARAQRPPVPERRRSHSSRPPARGSVAALEEIERRAAGAG